MSTEAADAADLLEQGKDLAALEILQGASAAGDPAAQCLLGWMHQVGRGVQENQEIAEQLYASASAAGDAVGQFYLGCLLQASGDLTRATEWFSKSAGQGFGAAFYRLGRIALRSADTVQAEAFFRRGAVARHLPSGIELVRLANRGAPLLKRIASIPRNLRILVAVVRVASRDINDPRLLR